MALIASTLACSDPCRYCSFSPYLEHVPYITANPEVRSIALTSADRYLILATDGVWEVCARTVIITVRLANRADAKSLLLLADAFVRRSHASPP